MWHSSGMHVVTKPVAPFRSGNGALEVHQIPVWKDNLAWLAVCTKSGEAALVDSPEASPIDAYCRKRGLLWKTIFNTHGHADHVGANKDLEKRGKLASFRVVGSATHADTIPGITERVTQGDLMAIGKAWGRVLLTEGHVNGHVSFVFDDVLFCGDTLFTGGCGYLFDGPPSKMYQSLTKLAVLPGKTRVCCAHEYTQDNLRFAFSVEPENTELRERIKKVWALRAKGECAVPSTMAEERATNPFLRCDSPELIENLSRLEGKPGGFETSESVFAAARALKDKKLYKEITDDQLPV